MIKKLHWSKNKAFRLPITQVNPSTDKSATILLSDTIRGAVLGHTEYTSCWQVMKALAVLGCSELNR